VTALKLSQNASASAWERIVRSPVEGFAVAQASITGGLSPSTAPQAIHSRIRSFVASGMPPPGGIRPGFPGTSVCEILSGICRAAANAPS